MDTPAQLARALAAGLMLTGTSDWGAVVAQTLHLTWEAALVAGAVTVVTAYVLQVHAAQAWRLGPESLRLTLARLEVVDEYPRPTWQARWVQRVPGNSVVMAAGSAGRGLVALALYGLALVASRVPSMARAPRAYRGRVVV